MKKVNNAAAFAEKLIDAYISNGFGSLSKQNIDILVAKLLLDDNYISLEDDYFETGRKLKVSPIKAKNLLYSVQLRYGEELNFKEEFEKILAHFRFKVNTSKSEVFIEIDNPLQKDLFLRELRKYKLFSDGSFRAEVIHLSLEAFSILICETFGVKNLAEFELFDKTLKEKLDYDSNVSFVKSLLKEFAKSYSSELGKQSAVATIDLLKDTAFGIKWIGKIADLIK